MTESSHPASPEPVPMDWQDMATAPTDGRHCILAIEEDGFIYSVQGAYDGRQWNAVHRENVKPLCWMPNVRLPSRFLPERYRSVTRREPRISVSVPAELAERTFAVQHNPRCPSPFLVRLPGKGGRIDMKPYRDGLGFVEHETQDILGFGKTLGEAARIALSAATEASNDVG